MAARSTGERYADRAAAGRVLGAALAYLAPANPLVLGLPRGGVPVAVAVRDITGGDVGVLLVRKLGVPGQPELAMGAVGESGVRILNDDVLAAAGVTPAVLAESEHRERRELARRARALRPAGSGKPLRGRVVVLVDDGVATGATALAACQAARVDEPRQLVFAAPVAAAAALQRLRFCADVVVCPLVATEFAGVGAYYDDFHQLDDAEVWKLLGG